MVLRGAPFLSSPAFRRSICDGFMQSHSQSAVSVVAGDAAPNGPTDLHVVAHFARTVEGTVVRWLGRQGTLSLYVCIASCSGKATSERNSASATPGNQTAPWDGGAASGPDVGASAKGDGGAQRLAPTDKLDILFDIDNSASMGDKQAYLARAIPDLINRLVNPNCVDVSGTVTGLSTMGLCPTGSVAEFPPVRDMHLGIVSSSLGSRLSETGVTSTFPNALCAPNATATPFAVSACTTTIRPTFWRGH